MAKWGIKVKVKVKQSVNFFKKSVEGDLKSWV